MSARRPTGAGRISATSSATPRTLGFAPAFLWRNRVAKMRLPGFLPREPRPALRARVPCRAAARPESRLTLADARDRLGQPRLRIDLRFGPERRRLGRPGPRGARGWLARNRLARLDYYRTIPRPGPRRCSQTPRTAPTRSGRSAWARAGEGVVDGRCRVFGTPGLYVVSTAVLPTSGQANPTLTAVQLGLRLAEDMAHAEAAREVNLSYIRVGGRLACAEGAGKGRRGMRRVTLGTTGIETSCLGFGCASLGSRVGEGPGLRALAAAHDAGVSWFDLAPLYGAGRAEEIAGRFLKGRTRDSCPALQQGRPRAPRRPGPGGLKAALMPLARAAVQAVPSLRGLLRRGGAQPAEARPLTPALLTGTIEESLRRLGTDHLDLYALHGAAAAALTERGPSAPSRTSASSGKARAIAVASDAAAGLAATRIGNPFGVVQAAAPAPGGAVALLAAARVGEASASSCTRFSASTAASPRSRPAPPRTRPSGRR